MNAVEREAIVLNTAWAMIDDMVNWGIFVKHDRRHETNLMFHDSPHRRLFVILLADFLSPVRAHRAEPVPLGLVQQPSNTKDSDRTFLFQLRHICGQPQLGVAAADLLKSVEEFATWLEREFIAKNVNLGLLGSVDIPITRYRYVRMCGDIAKHNPARLSDNIKHFRRLLDKAGKPISDEQAYLALDDFFQWFYDDILIAHSSILAAFLNNIRWEMYEYLGSEYSRSWHRPEGAPSLFCSYRYPNGCDDPVARGMYWDLMNRVRARPFASKVHS